MGVLVVVALAAPLIGCGSDETPTPAMTPSAAPTPTTQTAAAATQAPTPTATPAPAAPTPTTQTAAAATQAPTPTATPAPVAPAPPPAAAVTPAPTPGNAREAHPSDAFFALDRVLYIDIEITPEDWDTLRRQTRTFEDLMAEIETYGLSQPFADIYTWFAGKVTVDGETHTDVGVRKKGFIGSQSDTKPSLKLRFDKYVDGQTLAGVMERMTLNNSIQDPSMVNTCLAYQIFAAAGLPSPRCNFATVSVNGNDLGLYVHVEEIKPPFLARHFASAEGNLYEGTVSDFIPEFRGTFEKKTNEDADDWVDIDAVASALQDPSGAGLEALARAVDLDRFLSFWATEVLVGHWDGYTGDRNNYHFYREPDGPFVFIPWGVDDTFHLKDDPNPFDDISNPPPSVLALTAIPNRLYNNPNWRVKYVSRLKELLDTVWKEEDLLARVDEMAAIVRQHGLPETRTAAAVDAERVRQFIKIRRAEILDDLTPDPPDWPEPEQEAGQPIGLVGEFEPGTVELQFETSWGSNQSVNPFEEGTVTHFMLNETGQPLANLGVTAGLAGPDEKGLLPGIADAASLTVFSLGPDGSIQGFVFVLPMARLSGSATLVIGEGEVAGGRWVIPAGAAAPDKFSIFTGGRLELIEAGMGPGAAISVRFYGSIGGAPVAESGNGGGEETSATPPPPAASPGLIINEVASQGKPLDWFELYNSSGSHLALANFVVADDLADADKRVAFPSDLVIPPGEYLQIELDKDGWPGFALGKDEELGIWTSEGDLVAQVDWSEGQSVAGDTYARVPDVTGDFQTVIKPTPGAANEPDN